MEPRVAVDALTLRGVPGLGDRGFKALVDRFGTPGAVLRAAASELRERGDASAILAEAIGAARRSEESARREVARAEALGIGLRVYGTAEYPRLLAEIPDPPAVLYVAGELPGEGVPTVAVVGSRRASTHGVRFGRRLARDLAEAGVSVVSGLAQGVDAAAHRGTLDAGGSTVAVFGSGLDVVYPDRHRDLAVAIRGSGALVGEFPLGSEPRPHHFPRRNRVVSGLSLGVVVIEAAGKSGSLITANHALEQGREVFAVPGIPGSYTAQGAHRLLREGARLVEHVSDVLNELSLPGGRCPVGVREPMPPTCHRKLWETLEDTPLHIDEVAARASLGAAEAAAGLMELVLEGHAEEWPGKRYVRSRGS